MMYTGIPVTYTGTKPAKVTGSGSTITTTLPVLTWTAYTEQAANAEWSSYTKVGTNDEYRVYVMTEQSGGRTRVYQYYDWTEFRSECTSTITYYKQDMQIRQWEINGVTYNAGEEITITGDGMITAKAKVTTVNERIPDPDKAQTKDTIYKTLYGYVAGELVKTTKINSNYYKDGRLSNGIYSPKGTPATQVEVAVASSANAATDPVDVNMTAYEDDFLKFLSLP